MASLLLSVTLAASSLGGLFSQLQGTRVLIVPPSCTVAAGDTVTVEVEARDVTDLYAVELCLDFDPARLEVHDADGNTTNGVQVATGGLLQSPHSFTAINSADNIAGQIRYVYTLLSPAVAVSGDGVLICITFRALSPGSSALLLRALLINDRAQYIPTEVSNGLIIVTGHTPTVTPEPSWTAAHTATPTVTSTRTPTLVATATASPAVSPTLLCTPTVPQTGTITPAMTPLSACWLFLPVLLRSGGIAGPSPTPAATLTPVTVSTVTPFATAVSRQLLQNPSFEEDAAWFREGGAEPVYTMARARSGVRSMRLGIILPYSEPVWSSVRQEVDLPVGVKRAWLSLHYFPGGWPEDLDDLYLYLTRTSDGIVLLSQRWMRWEQTWHPFTVDLSDELASQAGQRVRLRIGVYNNGVGATAVCIDDVELWVQY